MTKKELIGNLTAEFLPIATFAIVSETKGFQTGLIALIATTVVTFSLSVSIERRLPKFGLFAAGTIVAFAALSVATHNPSFIIIKDTLYYGGFALALSIGALIGRSPFRFFFSDFMAISTRGWSILERRWMIFFALLAIGNEFARRSLVPEDWTLYKLMALFVTWGFGFYQLTLTHRERLPEAAPLGLRVSEKRTHGD